MNKELLDLMRAALEHNKFRMEQEVKAGKDPKFLAQENKIRIGQALNAAFALDAEKEQAKDITQILEDSIFYENLILIRQSLSMDELKEFLDKVKAVKVTE